jgi:hypothetical protein
MKARDYDSPLINELINETTPEELNKIDKQMKPKLERCSFTFNQEGNTKGTTDDVEILTIECESPLGIDNDEGCFYVLKTDGWSIDNVNDLQELFDRIQKVIQGGDK